MRAVAHRVLPPIAGLQSLAQEGAHAVTLTVEEVARCVVAGRFTARRRGRSTGLPHYRQKRI
ncbi:MAG: hypothetical protein ACLFU8_17070 [Anaerolineales bacterium]